MLKYLPILALLVAGCVTTTESQAPRSAPQSKTEDPVASTRAKKAARQFVQVVETVEPVAEALCRQRLPRANCDFKIVIDDTPSDSPNAFQTLDRRGRPILAFNLAMIAGVRNPDELAFVMGHEAAHHIRSHIARTRENANAGAVIFAGLASLSGASADAVRSAQRVGATVGARTYSKEFELEADELGTIIAARAGYDPVRGSAFFNRIPDPGDRFLGTHPPNAARREIVIATARKL